MCELRLDGTAVLGRLAGFLFKKLKEKDRIVSNNIKKMQIIWPTIKRPENKSSRDSKK